MVIAVDFGTNPDLPLFVSGVVELLRDLFDLPISVGTIHNRLQVAAEQAAAINQSQNLSAIDVGLHDEITRVGDLCWWECSLHLLLNWLRVF